jgi:tRNA(fMet)-specific endonuclease VapC
VKYLLDAGVIASAIRGRLPVVLKLSQLKPGDVAVSAVSRVECEGALRQPAQPARSQKLLREFLAAVRTIEFGPREAQQAVTLAQYAQGDAEKMSALDLLVAATAVTHQLTLVTERVSRFGAVPNLDVESWK